MLSTLMDTFIQYTPTNYEFDSIWHRTLLDIVYAAAHVSLCDRHRVSLASSGLSGEVWPPPAWRRTFHRAGTGDRPVTPARAAPCASSARVATGTPLRRSRIQGCHAPADGYRYAPPRGPSSRRSSHITDTARKEEEHIRKQQQRSELK